MSKQPNQKTPKPVFEFLSKQLGLGYHFWKLQARSVKLEYRHWRSQNQSTKTL